MFPVSSLVVYRANRRFETDNDLCRSLHKNEDEEAERMRLWKSGILLSSPSSFRWSVCKSVYHFRLVRIALDPTHKPGEKRL